ncbi:Carboxylesterase type B [Penicillium antarcticum]|uniref:Carboxylesterase type B n=1 Tax=Penicillium antarcticum TaxID=416450 RepID=UPI00238A2638|nr:Carboxylesterase type B [Penicillium antarcticum]KAJ5305993.1 Carboxylesterase type B [Penicillium antarcticum]
MFVTASRAARPLFGEAYLHPTIDDDVFQDRPSDMTQTGNFDKGIPLIASWVTNDEAWYVLLSIVADDEFLANFGLWLHKLSESTKEKLFASCTDPKRKRFVLSPTISQPVAAHLRQGLLKHINPLHLGAVYIICRPGRNLIAFHALNSSPGCLKMISREMPAYSQPGPSPSSSDTRSLHGDEFYALNTYQTHAQSCPYCGAPLDSSIICDEGLPLARRLTEYISQRRNSFFALRSHDDDRTDRVRIPVQAYAIRALLAAVEQGLCISTATRSSPNTGNDGPHAPVGIEERQSRDFLQSPHILICKCSRWKRCCYVRCSSRPLSCLPNTLGATLGVGCSARRSKVRFDIQWVS